MSDATTTRRLEPGLDDPEVAAAFERWKAARKALTEAALPLAALADEALDVNHVSSHIRWRNGYQLEELTLVKDDAVIERYREAKVACERANEALSKLSGLVR